MGILNVTPDSFSGDGLVRQTDAAFNQAVAMMAAGADLIDVGAESTRPGADFVSADEELDRLMPLLAKLKEEGIPVSVDTYKAKVMKEALGLGAGLINDISSLADSESASVLAAYGNTSLCLMHMQGEPRTMQQNPFYEDIEADVLGFLKMAVRKAESSGIESQRLILDPGFGFGKTIEHNQILFRSLPQLVKLGFPVLVGVSRKTMVGQLTGKPVEERLAGSIVAACLAAQYGAAIIRVHDVAQTVDGLKVIRALGPKFDEEQ
jgi:dihydropteroate synthase